MNKFTPELIDNLAKKILIGLNEEENKLVLEDFNFIEKNMNLITQINGIENIEPMSHPFPIEDCLLREDIPEPSEIIEELLSNCDKTKDREIEVPKVVGE